MDLGANWAIWSTLVSNQLSQVAPKSDESLWYFFSLDMTSQPFDLTIRYSKLKGKQKGWGESVNTLPFCQTFTWRKTQIAQRSNSRLRYSSPPSRCLRRHKAVPTSDCRRDSRQTYNLYYKPLSTLRCCPNLWWYFFFSSWWFFKQERLVALSDPFEENLNSINDFLVLNIGWRVTKDRSISFEIGAWQQRDRCQNFSSGHNFMDKSVDWSQVSKKKPLQIIHYFFM